MSQADGRGGIYLYPCKGTKLGMKFIIYGWMQLKRLNGISCTFCTTTEISQTTFEFHECGIAKDALKFNAKSFCSFNQPQILNY